MIDYNNKFLEFIKENNLIEENDKIIIGFSGGPDSVFAHKMINSIKDIMNIDVVLAHVNHMIRDDSNNDIKFLEKYADENNIELYIKNINIPEMSKKEKKGIEEIGRRERYKYFEDLLHELNATKIVTGHNLNDNIETFVFRLIRGSSLKGLKSIPVKRKNIVRPILCFEKEDIMIYLKANNIEYLVDNTNMENKYTRNKIRNEIFPLFNEINPKFKEKIQNLIHDINHISYTNMLDNNVINIETFYKKNELDKKEEIKEFLLKNEISYSREKIDNIIKLINSNGSKEINIGNNFKVVKDYDKIIIKKENEKNVESNKTLFFGETLQYYNYEISFVNATIDSPNLSVIDKKQHSIYIDNNIDELLISSRKQGDFIYHNGVRKTIKKIFINNKISRWVRDEIPIISHNGEILLVGDLFISDKIIKSKPTNRVLKIRRTDV